MFPVRADLVIKKPNKEGPAAACEWTAAVRSIVLHVMCNNFSLLCKRNNHCNKNAPLYSFKSDHFLKMTWRWPYYLRETETPHKEVVIPFLDFPAFNRRQKDKDFIHSKRTKEEFTSCTKANNPYNFKSWVPGLFALNSALKDLCLYDSHCQFY